MSFDASFVIPKINTTKIPSAPNWIGSPPVSVSTTKGRELRAEINRWVAYQHAVVIQTALDTSRTEEDDGLREARYSMVHWHPAFLCDAMQHGWKPGN